MSNCINCGAPLQAGSTVCNYCSTQNDLDLKQIHYYTKRPPDDARLCPHCRKPMDTLDLKIEGTFLIEKCEDCRGLFFDPGELNALLDHQVTHVYEIDYKQLADLGAQAYQNQKQKPLKYINCPVCGKIMNRRQFGIRSGIVVDYCKGHGIWLDAGELKHLLKWVKAGGQLLHQKRLNADGRKEFLR